MSTSVYGLANSHTASSEIVQQLCDAGFSPDDISVLFADNQSTRDFAFEKHTKAPEGTVTGGVTGGVAGGALGLLAGLGSIAIPGLGAFIAAGPLLAALSGAAVGAAVGGIAGALIGMGIPEFEAKRYETKVRAGKALISVHAHDNKRIDMAKDIFKRNGAEDVSTAGEAATSDRSHTTGVLG